MLMTVIQWRANIAEVSLYSLSQLVTVPCSEVFAQVEYTHVGDFASLSRTAYMPGACNVEKLFIL
jgi:hypothetical protein